MVLVMTSLGRWVTVVLIVAAMVTVVLPVAPLVVVVLELQQSFCSEDLRIKKSVQTNPPRPL